MSLGIVPMDLTGARAFVAEHHRHNDPPIGHKYSIGLMDYGDAISPHPMLVGVVIVSRPIARGNDDGRTLEVTRLAIIGSYSNGCSMLYGAACRAAFAMGYRRVITYTLESEHGSSLKAAGFRPEATTRGREWSHVGPRSADKPTMFFDPKMPTEDKRRWVRTIDDHLRDQLHPLDATR